MGSVISLNDAQPEAKLKIKNVCKKRILNGLIFISLTD